MTTGTGKQTTTQNHVGSQVSFDLTEVHARKVKKFQKNAEVQILKIRALLACSYRKLSLLCQSVKKRAPKTFNFDISRSIPLKSLRDVS